MKNKKKISFRALLTMLVCLPLLITAVILTLANAIEMKNELSTQYLKALDSANKMLYEQTKRGEGVDSLSYDEATDTLILNGDDVSGLLDPSFDQYKKDTGIDVMVFVGDRGNERSFRKDY